VGGGAGKGGTDAGGGNISAGSRAVVGSGAGIGEERLGFLETGGFGWGYLGGVEDFTKIPLAISVVLWALCAILVILTPKVEWVEPGEVGLERGKWVLPGKFRLCLVWVWCVYNNINNYMIIFNEVSKNI
jgi:hypothetical protein